VIDDEDAFGHLLQDYLRGEQGIELVERDDGFIGPAGSMRQYFASFPDWPSHERAAMAWVRGRVLDIGCGAGRHALYLQGQGFTVRGIDISPLAIAVCRRRGLRDACVQDIEDIDPAAGPWDTVLLLGANFGLLGNAAGVKTILAKLHHSTSPDARIIAESLDPASSTEHVHRAYQEANLQQGRLPGELRLRIRYKQYATPWFSYLFVSKSDLAQLLEGTGWRATHLQDVETGTGAYIALIERVSPSPTL